MTRGRVVAKASVHSARHHSGAVFVDPARRHASMRRLNDDSDTFRAQDLLDDVCYLGGEAFLNLKSAKKKKSKKSRR